MHGSGPDLLKLKLISIILEEILGFTFPISSFANAGSLHGKSRNPDKITRLQKKRPSDLPCRRDQTMMEGRLSSTQNFKPFCRSRCVSKVQCKAQGSESYTHSQPENRLQKFVTGVGTALMASTVIFTTSAHARPEGVNRPELLPKGDYSTVIDVAGFLTDGEEKRIKAEIEGLEKDKGIKLRVLAQNYPETPGLAIRDYWKVDGDTVVFVADPSLGGNILNFNVGENIDLLVPQNFWSRLAGKFGTKFYWQDKGEGQTISTTVTAIDSCFREPIGKLQCSKIQGEFGEEPSSGGFGKFFFGS